MKKKMGMGGMHMMPDGSMMKNSMMKKGGSIGPKKKGGMAAYEKSSYDKKMDAKGAHEKEGSEKDMAADKKAASSMGYMKKGGSVGKKPKMKEGGSTSFGMLSVKKGVDNNPKPTAADRIAGATMKKGGTVKSKKK